MVKSAQAKVSQELLLFLAEIVGAEPDAELRAYERNVPKLIQRFQSVRRIARYPRRGG